ncbi:Uncharacterized protein E6C27_scaffold129G00110 [Cucumis melo var. makuwa]|uniref:Uncharacterized protein n=1 Tax=Cucumis melo var. makuwa TaxID=1194695 RepID=A0A5A7TLA6_CUCMM|nr:Uncharacterized protein E6C27_scaffold129G00110 [Cucumis melo var. makuwa]
MEGPINNDSKSNCPKAQAEILLVRVMVEACLTVRPTGRTETKVSHSDLGVPCGRALAQQIKEVIKDLIHSGTDAPTYLLLNRYGPIPLKDLLLPLMFGIRTRPFESKIYHIHEPPPMMRSSSFRVLAPVRDSTSTTSNTTAPKEDSATRQGKIGFRVTTLSADYSTADSYSNILEVEGHRFTN